MEGASGNLVVTALPCRHWTRRAPLSTNRRLWASWALARRGPSSSPGTGENGPSVYFGGDSGYAPVFREIGDRLGPFDATLLPIGAYEPRWFMESAHMNPEEAVRAYRDLGGTGAFVAMHWGTFQLTDEPVLEPPARTREAWSAAALPGARLHVPAHGETLEILVGRGLRD